MTERRWRLVVPAIALLLLASGCSDDDPAPLATDDLPSKVVKDSTATSGFPSVSSCPALNTAQEKVSVSSASEDEHGYRYWQYWLDDGTYVSVAVMTLGYPFEDPDTALASVRDAVGTCTDEESAGGHDEALDGLPDDVVGYRSTKTDSNGDREGTTVLATAGDRIVSISTSQDAGSTPSVDAADLLSDVRDRAADLDLS